MPKITFIGAGSTVFAKNPLVDILSFSELAALIQTNVNILQEKAAVSKRERREHDPPV